MDCIKPRDASNPIPDLLFEHPFGALEKLLIFNTNQM